MPWDEHDTPCTNSFPLLGDLSEFCEELFLKGHLPSNPVDRIAFIQQINQKDVPGLVRGLNSLCVEGNKSLGLDYECDSRLKRDFLCKVMQFRGALTLDAVEPAGFVVDLADALYQQYCNEIEGFKSNGTEDDIRSIVRVFMQSFAGDKRKYRKTYRREKQKATQQKQHYADKHSSARERFEAEEKTAKEQRDREEKIAKEQRDREEKTAKEQRDREEKTAKEQRDREEKTAKEQRDREVKTARERLEAEEKRFQENLERKRLAERNDELEYQMRAAERYDELRQYQTRLAEWYVTMYIKTTEYLQLQFPPLFGTYQYPTHPYPTPRHDGIDSDGRFAKVNTNQNVQFPTSRNETGTVGIIKPDT